MTIKAGDMVQIFIFVGKKRVPMGRGKVIKVHSGYCEVDHCYPYGAPWIYGEPLDALEKVED